MILIAHRGNLAGPSPEQENRQRYIEFVFDDNIGHFHAEIDLWLKDGDFYSGHDGAIHAVSLRFLRKYKERLWIHAKNVECFVMLCEDFNCFMHDKDPLAITTDGVLWTTDKRILAPGRKTVHVDHKGRYVFSMHRLKLYGFCSDYVGKVEV